MPHGCFERRREAIAASCAAALQGLLRAQDTEGRWRDFPEVGGGSDEWVTGYIGAAVAPAAPLQAARAWAHLAARQRWSGGWGFMPSYPADADSTVCALRLEQLLSPRAGVRGWRARAFLARHQRANGGISTYVWPRRMMWHTRLRDRFDGWCSPHICVSANAARLGEFRGLHRLLDFLADTQQAEGSWRAYWWHDEREYATALAAEALAESPQRRHRTAVDRAIEWARHASRLEPVVKSSAVPDGSAFATALRLRVLCLQRGADKLAGDMQTMIDWLIDTQRPSGLWPASACLRFPATEVVDTTTIREWHIGQMVRAGVMTDGHALFTTATVLQALRAVMHAAAGA
jgi:hypothetical protein